MRVGIGYDIHRLIDGRDLILGGVKIPFEKGLDGDSDADVLVHAIIDALLGAAGLGDIGTVFGTGLMGVISTSLLERAYKMVNGKIRNVDATICAENPRLSPYLSKMRKNIASILEIPEKDVNIKSTTQQGLGDIGKGRAICAYVTLLL